MKNDLDIEQLLQSLADGDIPPEAYQIAEEAAEETVKKITPSRKPYSFLNLPIPMPAKVTASALAVIVISIGLLAVFGIFGGSGLAFSDMLETILRSHSVSYTETVCPKDQSEYTIERMAKQPGYLRSLYPDNSIIIQNFTVGKSLQLWPDQGKALLMQREYSERAGSPFSSLDWVCELSEDDGVVIGRERCEGLKCDVFLVEGDFGDIKICVDIKTKLPVHLESTQLHPDALIEGPKKKLSRRDFGDAALLDQLFSQGSSGQRVSKKIVLRDFKWNIDLDKGLFSLEPPDGYTRLHAWREHLITDSFPSTSIAGCDFGDMDNDGDVDIIVGGVGWGYGDLYWYENDGNRNFIEHCITRVGENGSNWLADIDLDGDMDILSQRSIVIDKMSRPIVSRITAWLNDGSNNYTVFEIVEPDTHLYNPIFPTDLDGDHDLDLVFYRTPGIFMWMENRGNLNFIEHIIDGTHPTPSDIVFVDMENDDDLDIVSWRREAVYLWENNGEQQFTKRLIANPEHLYTLCPVDMDRDGDGDFLASFGSPGRPRISWLENDGYLNFTEHLISDNVENVHLLVRDMEDDGDFDIISTDQHQDTVKLLENDGNQRFTEQLIKSSFFGANGLLAADLDNDQDVDLLANASWQGVITWWENMEMSVLANLTCEPISDVDAFSSSMPTPLPIDLVEGRPPNKGAVFDIGTD